MRLRSPVEDHAELALNNTEHASTGLTPFFAINARHPRVPALLAVGHHKAPRSSTLGWYPEVI